MRVQDTGTRRQSIRHVWTLRGMLWIFGAVLLVHFWRGVCALDPLPPCVLPQVIFPRYEHRTVVWDSDAEQQEARRCFPEGSGRLFFLPLSQQQYTASSSCFSRCSFKGCHMLAEGLHLGLVDFSLRNV